MPCQAVDHWGRTCRYAAAGRHDQTSCFNDTATITATSSDKDQAPPTFHVLQVQVVTAAVPEAGRFLGEIRPLDLWGDVASGGRSSRTVSRRSSMPIEGRFASWCGRRENRDVALLE